MLLLTMHHIISDGWSILGVLMRELGELLYSGFSERRALATAPLEVQYADYALWQRGGCRERRWRASCRTGRAAVRSAGHVELPTDYPRPPMPSYRGAHPEAMPWKRSGDRARPT